jgi:hypothetical protein
MASRIFIIIGACGLAFYILLSVLLGGGNVIGGLAFFAAVASGIIGVSKPRAAMYYLVVLAAYSDLLKRFLIYDGRFGYMDIMWVRALCPLTLAGIFIGVMARGLYDGIMLKKRHVVTLLLCFAGFGLAAISALRSGGGFGGLTNLADGASYMFLLIIVPCLMKTPGQIVRFVKFSLWVFIPVSLYGLKQQFIGLSAFEIDYLKSGFTILSKHLEDTRPRPFSTLTDSSPFGTTCAVCACLALMVRSHYRSNGFRSFGFLGPVFWVIFVAGCIASMTRTANLNWFLPIMLLPLFSRGRATFMVYLGMALSFAVACVFARPIKEVVTRATLWALENFGGTALGEQLARFWTIGARLDGMHELAHNPKMWTMFGYGPKLTDQLLASGEVASHDIISTMLLHVGWLPLLLFLIIAAWCLTSLHKAVLNLRNTPVFSMCVWLLATEFGLLVHNVFAGNVTATFPVNLYFWFIAGALNSNVCFYQERQQQAAAEPDARPPERQVYPSFQPAPHH